MKHTQPQETTTYENRNRLMENDRELAFAVSYTYDVLSDRAQRLWKSTDDRIVVTHVPNVVDSVRVRRGNLTMHYAPNMPGPGSRVYRNHGITVHE